MRVLKSCICYNLIIGQDGASNECDLGICDCNKYWYCIAPTFVKKLIMKYNKYKFNCTCNIVKEYRTYADIFYNLR